MTYNGKPSSGVNGITKACRNSSVSAHARRDRGGNGRLAVGGSSDDNHHH